VETVIKKKKREMLFQKRGHIQLDWTKNPPLTCRSKKGQLQRKTSQHSSEARTVGIPRIQTRGRIGLTLTRKSVSDVGRETSDETTTTGERFSRNGSH